MASFFFVALSSAILAFLAAEFVLGKCCVLTSQTNHLSLTKNTPPASILLSTQAFILFLTFFLTIFAISTYLFVRFVSLVRDQGRTGVNEWAYETKGHFLTRNTREGEAVVTGKEDAHGRGNEVGPGEDGVKVEG
jgi:hypothetical protein